MGLLSKLSNAVVRLPPSSLLQFYQAASFRPCFLPVLQSSPESLHHQNFQNIFENEVVPFGGLVKLFPSSDSSAPLGIFWQKQLQPLLPITNAVPYISITQK
jgi:hypothetical protein